MDALDSYRYRGARAMVVLHERHLRSFVAVWRRARAADLALPETDDSSYASLETLLRHVLAAARGYLTWMCEKLGLPDPGIEAPPGPGEVEAQAERYLDHLAQRWLTPLAAVDEERFGEVYDSRWGLPYSIDAMLEHAVMHPIRHQFQLESLLEQEARTGADGAELLNRND